MLGKALPLGEPHRGQAGGEECDASTGQGCNQCTLTRQAGPDPVLLGTQDFAWTLHGRRRIDVVGAITGVDVEGAVTDVEPHSPGVASLELEAEVGREPEAEVVGREPKAEFGDQFDDGALGLRFLARSSHPPQSKADFCTI